MGKTFDALRRVDTQSNIPRERAPLAGEVAEKSQTAATNRGDNFETPTGVPFIEVGPHKVIEASPGLLDHPPVAPSRQRNLVLEDEVPLLTPLIEEAPQPRSTPVPHPLEVSFRPIVPSSQLNVPPARPQLAPELIAYHCPEHHASARFEALLDTLLSVVPSAKSAAFYFTSALFGVGTTTVLLNLALTAARRQLRVVVIDANDPRPGIAAKLDLDEQPGLHEVLSGEKALDEAIQESEQINLYALTNGARRTASGSRFMAVTMRSVLRDLRRKFDLVLVDGPRWNGHPEVIAAGVACDAVFVVMPESAAESPQMDQLVQMIPEQGARLGGCILAA